MNERWEVGAEYDEEIFRRLSASLKELGFSVEEEISGMAGSQDYSRWKATLRGATLVIEAETYAGLSVDGPAEAVRLVRRRFESG